MEACEKMGLTSRWMDEKNRELGLISESTKDAEDEKMELDAETTAKEFIQKIYQDITPTMERVLTSNDSPKLVLEVERANNLIREWQASHLDDLDLGIVNLIDIEVIFSQALRANLYIERLEKNPLNAKTREAFNIVSVNFDRLKERKGYP
jgi:hypothetical protein